MILCVVYLVFVGLGLPNGLLGSAWPIMQTDFGASLSSAGAISLIIYCGMIISSSSGGKLIARLGHAKVALIASLVMALSMLAFWAAPSFVWLLAAAFPLGLGSGAVDGTINHYVSVHYRTSHMNWLHCFWGVGAALGPMIMAGFLGGSDLWRGGYLTVGLIQFCIAGVVVVSLSKWKRWEQAKPAEQKTESFSRMIKIPGVKISFISFFAYCGIEAGVALWGSSFLISVKGISAQTAAEWVSMFFIGITLGRFLAGFITMALSGRTMIRWGLVIGAAGALLMAFAPWDILVMAGLLLLGLGSAPIVPCMLQETPRLFGEKEAQYIIGYQMASAFAGSAAVPPVLGLLADTAGIGFFPWAMLALLAVIIACSEGANKAVVRN